MAIATVFSIGLFIVAFLASMFAPLPTQAFIIIAAHVVSSVLLVVVTYNVVTGNGKEDADGN